MADLSAITAWAVNNSARHNITLTKLAWIDEWLPGFFDYRVKLRVGTEVYAGRGIDTNENTACDKALAEALERAAVADMPSPWAAAAYPGYTGAAERAYRELVSIDRVLCHHYCKEPFRLLDLSILKKPFPPDLIKRMLVQHGLHLVLCELRPVSDATVAAAFIWSEREHRVKGIVCGYGCEIELPDAAAHALIECLRTAVAVFGGDVTPEPWETKCVPGNPQWHFWMAQKEEAKNFLARHLLPASTTQTLWKPEQLSQDDVELKEISSMGNQIKDLPVRIVQATSPKLLRPQFGNISMDAEFLGRLDIFHGARVTPEETVPHFYD